MNTLRIFLVNLLVLALFERGYANFILAFGGNQGVTNAEIVTGTGSCLRSTIAGVNGMDCPYLFRVGSSIYVIGTVLGEKYSIYKWTPPTGVSNPGSWALVYEALASSIPNSCGTLCAAQVVLYTPSSGTPVLYIMPERTTDDCSTGTFGSGSFFTGSPGFSIVVIRAPTDCSPVTTGSGCTVPTTDGFFYVCPKNGAMFKYTVGAALPWTTHIPSVTNPGEDLMSKCTTIGSNTPPDVFVPRNTNADSTPVIGATYLVSGASVAARVKVADVNMAAGTVMTLRSTAVVTCGAIGILGGSTQSSPLDYLANVATTTASAYTTTLIAENLVANRPKPGLLCLTASEVTSIGVPSTCTTR